MEDNWAIDSKAKWPGQRSQADNPNHRKSAGEVGLSQGKSGHVVQGWPQADAATNNAALIDDAIGQFGNLTIGEPAVQGVIEPLGTVASVQIAGEGHGMMPPRCNVFMVESIQSPFPTQSQGIAANGAPLEWGARYQHHQYRQQSVVGERESFPNVGGGASSCGARGQQAIGGGRGSDGVWRDEQGKRLYTEEEVRKAVSQECRAWRDHSASLETQLAKTKDEATAALKEAEKVIAEMAEKLRMSESKTYALSVHLAKSNRPPHVA